MSDECSYCMTPVLIQTLGEANKEISKLRRKIKELELRIERSDTMRHSLQEQVYELMAQKKEGGA